MRIELQENGIRTTGEKLQAGDIFCIDNPLDAFIRMDSIRVMDILSDTEQIDNFIYNPNNYSYEKGLFMAFSVKDNDICILPKNGEYIQLEGKMVLERY